MTTRDLEQVVESALLEAGVPEERARAAAARLGDELVQLPTKADLDERFRESEQRWDERLRQSERLTNERFDSVDHRFDAITARIEMLERTMWRVFIGMGTIMLAMFGAVFGALMYAVFGA
ncbi:MAG: hypothetical protein OXI41_14890 [Chloroflexota bacterium]|nr:hypothetical protein [Chloroflexota bacterium]